MTEKRANELTKYDRDLCGYDPDRIERNLESRRGYPVT